MPYALHPLPFRLPRLRLALALPLALLLGLGVAAAAEKEKEKTPRFVSLRADDVNLRAGPGDRYPIQWVFHRKGLPVEVTQEYDVWRKIRDSEGTEGWVHERMITGVRTLLVAGGEHVLRSEPEIGAAPVARAEPGVIGRVLECKPDWCRIDAQGVKGWLRRSEAWGLFPNETLP